MRRRCSWGCCWRRRSAASSFLRIAYYYVTVTASIAVGLFDQVRASAVDRLEKVGGSDEASR